MKSYNNSQKDKFLASVIQASFDSDQDPIWEKCKFNFAFFDSSQKASQSFDDCAKEYLCKLMWKLTDYSKSSLHYWRHQRVGGGGRTVLEVYDQFPKKSKFEHPKGVPHQASWARFRLEGKARLIGFVIPKGYLQKNRVAEEYPFCCNTFYVVFLDSDHQFYLS